MYNVRPVHLVPVKHFVAVGTRSQFSVCACHQMIYIHNYVCISSFPTIDFYIYIAKMIVVFLELSKIRKLM